MAAGHEVSVIVPRRVVRELNAMELPYKLLGFPSNLWSALRRWPVLGLWLCRRKLSRLQRQHRFDVWHVVVTYPTGVVFLDWQKRSKVPGLLRSVGDDLSTAPNGVGLRREPRIDALVRRFLPQARAVVALSRSMVADYETLGLSRERIHELPNAVDLERFRQPFDRRDVKARFGIPENTFVFLSVGRNHPQKDFPTLLKACAMLKASAAAKFRLIISGRDSGALADEVNKLGLREQVLLTEAAASHSGELPPQDLVELYRASDAFVMSSLLEGFSSALLESMAAGLPVIATCAPGIIEFVRDGKDAFIVPTSDPQALAEAMKRLLEDVELRKDFRERSLARAEAFGWPKITEAYLQLYRRLIE